MDLDNLFAPCNYNMYQEFLCPGPGWIPNFHVVSQDSEPFCFCCKIRFLLRIAVKLVSIEKEHLQLLDPGVGVEVGSLIKRRFWCLAWQKVGSFP